MRTLYILTALMILLPMSVKAENLVLPELFSVSNVAEGDVLNIRVEPQATASILGELAPDTSNLEVVAFSADGQWAQINAGEMAGWVARRFLKAEASGWKEKQLPTNLACYGTEPFWSLKHKDGKLAFSEPDNQDQTLQLQSVLDRGFEGDRLRGVVAADDDIQMSAVIQSGICSDGMSDRSFGLNATLILQGKDQEPRLLSGCCSIAPQQ